MSTSKPLPPGTDKGGQASSGAFLSLPYDVRYLMYQHLFPSSLHVYILVFGNNSMTILPEERIPTRLLLVCRALHDEVGAFMYNKYLYNIIGTKGECLANYGRFMQTMRKHVREEVHVNAFSNGAHSSTMCITLGVGDAKMAFLRKRQTGQPVEIRDLEREIAMKMTDSSPRSMPGWLAFSLMATCVAMVAILVALMIYGRP